MTSSTGVSARPALHHLEHVMGTVVVIDLYADATFDQGDGESLVRRACSILHDTDDIFSTWKNDSPLSRLRSGRATMEEMPDEVREVLDWCEGARVMSNGWFNPWAMPGGVDPTGFVKGWAAQRALSVLTHQGILGAMVNAAGDIATFGGPTRGTPFRIGITDPRNRDQIANVVDVTAAIATSGTYQRGEHLINPFSGRAHSRAASASVTGPDLGLTDALATACAVAGNAFLETLEDLEGYEGFVIDSDGSSHLTSQFPLSGRFST